jgi:hypothetical protein
MKTTSKLVRIASIFGFTAIAAGTMVGCGQAAPEESSATQSDAIVVNLGNVLYDPPSGSAPTQCTVRASDGTWTSMHCCPSGYAMIGARVDSNVFKCAQLFDTSGSRTADKWTQRNNMHACPFGSVMVGLRNDQNVLACQTLPSNPIISEQIDYGTNDNWPMHVCNPDGTNAYSTLTGIRADQNRFSCGKNSCGLFGSCTTDADCGTNYCSSGCCVIG